MPFDHCSTCKRCCHIDPDYPPLEVTLTASESKKYHSICIKTRCKFLGIHGCTLGEMKPFSCQMYPLVFDPKGQTFFYDTDCPVMPSYIEQLQSSKTVAFKHLRMIQKKVKQLMHKDVDFLSHNYAVDSEYFDIRVLPLPQPQKAP